jgi:hypothetical protein
MKRSREKGVKKKGGGRRGGLRGGRGLAAAPNGVPGVCVGGNFNLLN